MYLNAAILAGAILGAISGLLKPLQRQRGHLPASCLLTDQPLSGQHSLSQVKEEASSLHPHLSLHQPDFAQSGAVKLFSNNQYVSIAIPCASLISIAVWVFLEKTRLGYELKATGANRTLPRKRDAEKKNLILTWRPSLTPGSTWVPFLFLTRI